MLYQRYVGSGYGYQEPVEQGDSDLCADCSHTGGGGSVADDGFGSGADFLFAQYRNGDCVQPGHQCFQGRDFLCDAGACGGLAAGCDDGLFHFPMAQLRGAAGALPGR